MALNEKILSDHIAPRYLNYSGKPLVVILSTIVGVKIFSIFFFQNFFFKYLALIIIIHIGHAEN